MYNNAPKKYLIKIPKETIVIYCNKNKIITVIGPLKKKSIKLQVELRCNEKSNTIEVTAVPFLKLSNNEKKNIKAIQGTTVALIKQLLIETSSIFYRKLKFIGVGYRAFEVDSFEKQVLLFKLGYSHNLYFKIPENLEISSLKLTKLFISGFSYQKITQAAALIQSYKYPEPYKGKGILYESQKIQLKEGKKV
jgi:large subunit ribosomal protein L6